ncbi:MAG: hypothetical protein RJQ09_08640 [Cyclobacteriaceae bacterium]
MSILLLTIGCQNKSLEKAMGIPIEHAEGYYTTVESFELFDIHTWTHDTLFRYCGHEILIVPKDSLDVFEISTSGASIIPYQNNSNQFVLTATDSIVFLNVKVNNKTVTKRFISPRLPAPTLIRSTIGDSAVLTLRQDNSRLRDLLPKDCRYGFGLRDQFVYEVKVSNSTLDSIKFPIARKNYLNKYYPVSLSQ